MLNCEINYKRYNEISALYATYVCYCLGVDGVYCKWFQHFLLVNIFADFCIVYQEIVNDNDAEMLKELDTLSNWDQKKTNAF